MKLEWQRNLIALFIAHVIGLSALSSLNAFFPLYVETLGSGGMDRAILWAGASTGAMSFAMAFILPVWGHLSDRFGPKAMILRSMIGLSVGAVLLGLATSPEQVFAVRVIQGLFGGATAATLALIAARTPNDRMGFALGMIQVAAFVGNSFGPILGGLAADAFGYRAALWGSGLIGFIPAIITILYVREESPHAQTSMANGGILANAKVVLTIGIFPLLLAVIFVTNLGNTVVLPVLSVYVTQLGSTQNAATSAGIVMGVTAVVSATSALVVGRLGGRFGYAKTLMVCLIGSAVSYYPQGAVDSVWQLAIARIATGAFLGGMLPTANALVGQVTPPQHRGAAFGLTAASQSLANGVGPLAGAGIAAWWGIRAVFLATSVALTAACAWVGLGLRRQQAEPAALETATVDARV